MTRMRILFFHRWVGVRGGGTETHIRELVTRLSDRGHDVHVLTLRGNGVAKIKNVKVWTVSKGWTESLFSYEDPRQYAYAALFLIKAFLRLLALKLKGVEFDVVSVHFATEAILMRFVRKVFGWPYVFVLEGYTELEGKEAKAANGAVAISEDIVRRCENLQGFKPWKVSVGVDSSRFFLPEGGKRRSPLSKNGEKIILCVCRLEPRKDIPTLLMAMKQILKIVNARLVIVGNGLLKNQLTRMVKTMGLSESVTIDSETSYDNLPAYYQSADVFSMSTLYEGLGIVFLEAMSCGLPIVSTNVGAIPEIVDSSGILVPPRNPSALAQAIIRVLTDNELRHRLIECGNETVTHFDWSNLIGDYERIYKEVAHSHEPALD
jgi:glycosyltransferase involved in cell wall biosynthesis